ncbi:MAG: PLP-dependent aminotransferase family protein [Pseudomonadota bacterium]
METIWTPELPPGPGPLYRTIADKLAEDIRSARLAPGSQLPTMRALADQLEVTVGTVHRAYALAEQQGLIVRQMGRGSFVRDATASLTGTAALAPDGTIDLSRNEPVELPLGPILQRTLAAMAQVSDLDSMLDYGFSQGQPRHREALALWLKRRGYRIDPDHLIVTNGAQQALTIALGALARAGDTLLVEELTYPGIKNLARLFGLKLRALPMDDGGLLPDALAAAAAEPGARMLYCVPNAHNPTTATLDLERRQAIAEIAQRYGLIVIEDDLYPRHADAALPAIAEVAADHTVYISSLSKTVAPGLRIGSIAAPPRLLPDLVAVTQATSWMAPPLMAEVASRWIVDGTVDALAGQREHITRSLHQVAERALAGLAYRAEPHNTHLWLPLEAPWSGREFAAKAAERKILVSPAEHFAIDQSAVPAAVRICLCNVEERLLEDALGRLAQLARGGPGPLEFQM